MEGAPVRSRTSLTPSPSHSTASASASASSSAHYKRSSATNPKFPPPPSTDPPTAKPSFDDDDDDEDTEEPFEEEDEDDTEEPFDEDEDADMDDDDDDASAAPAPAPAVNAKDSTSMRTFTAARFDHLKNGGGSSSGGGAKPPKNEVKAEAGPATGAAVGGQQQPAGVAVAPQQQLNIPGIVVKDDPSKGIFTENIQTSGAYSTREEGLKREEDAGRLKFMCCANDGIDEHMIWLIGLKNIFARQLPNMPKEYIVRLVMDSGNFWKKYLLSAYYYRSLVKRLSVSQEQEEEEIVYFIIAGSHKSMMVIRHNLVVGGITYRPYISQRFGEIAFCAITADEQVKGYGTRLMNHLKQHARDVDGLTHFLTYADNNAVGYFIKQGFTKEITLEKERWHGYIKDYDGGILMECKINPKLPYTDLSTMIRRQRQAIDEKIRELSNCHIVYPGIDFQKKEAGIPRKPIKVEDIPGLREAGWTPDQYGHSRYKPANATDSVAYRQHLNDFMRSLLKLMNDHPDAWPFREPVDARDVPDYYDIIKDPMDLRTMSKRLESEQYYMTFEMFVADVKRMLANARSYNSPETIYYKCATRLETYFSNKVQAHLQTSSKSS